MQALAKDPQQRFENIQAFANALEKLACLRGERTEQISPTFHSLHAEPNKQLLTQDILLRDPSSPTNTPLFPLQSGTPGQPPTSPAQSGHFISPLTSRNLQDTAQADAHENFTPPFSQPVQPWTSPDREPVRPAQTPQQQVVLPSPPAYTPNILV